MHPKLKSYLSFTGLAMVAGTVQGQIVYTDIFPDVLITPPLSGGSQVFFLDLDNDGINEFKLEAAFASSSCSGFSSSYYTMQVNDIRIQGLTSGNTIRIDPTGTCNNFPELHRFEINQVMLNFPISTTIGFFFRDYSCNCQMIYGSSSGIDYYVGLKFQKNGGTRQAWLRYVQLNDILILKDYAYCDTVTTSLPAGTLNYNVGLEDISSAFTINCLQGELLVSSPEQNSFNAGIYTLLGTEVAVLDAPQGRCTYTFSGKGVFILKVQTEHGSFTKKVFVP